MRQAPSALMTHHALMGEGDSHAERCLMNPVHALIILGLWQDDARRITHD